jgi:quercetin dioxygenase-like cupin family protein
MMQQRIIPKAETDARADVQDWGTLRWVAGRELGNTDDVTVGLVTIKPGRCNTRHRHPNCDEILHLLEGTLEHTLDDERLVMHAGDTLSVRRGVLHNARNIGEADAQLLVVFTSANRRVEHEA